MILAISVLYLLWTVESFISQSTPFLHIQHHRTVKGISSKFSPRAKLSDEENKDRIKTALNKVGDEVTKNKGIKDINIDLVSRGQKFDSYRRRFDYYSLVASDENWLANVDSVWIRDNSRNVNVDEFLIATKGLSTEEAKLESKKLHSQSYCQEILSESGDATKEGMKTLGPTSCMKFKVTTLQGIPTIDDEGNNQQHGYERRVSWEGNAYIEELFDRNTNQKILKVEKTLIFDYDNIGNSMIMKVNSTLYSEKDSNEKCTITCQQYLNAAFNLDSNNAQVDNLVNHNVLRSKMNRVPGCVSNVNVCTTLIPIKKDNDESEPTYKVFVDGETDTLLSRGLLSVLSSVLSSLESKDILQIDAFTITEELNLRKVLSAGRNDGLSNMITIIQNQISEIIENQEKGISENMNNVDAVNNELERRPTVAMLLSGGVDSAVALNLLRRQNYNVTAFYLKIWLEDELSHLGQCPWEDDYNVCVDVCKHAGDIPLEAISLQEAYKERVISYTIGEAKKGRTPNPDIMCNSRIKFGCFYDEIANRGFDYVASGHYAQLQRVSDDGEMKLFRAPDPVKDQSYFLAALRQDQLMRVLFPIGHLQKPEVRSLAEEFDLPNKSRPDSQGLCFLGKVKFDEFLSAYLGQDPGEIVDAHTGEIIGEHKGIWYHTVGQRKGIGKVLHPKATSKGPWYVVAKDPKERRIIASNKYDEEIFEQTRSEFCVEDIHWISGSVQDKLDGSETKEMKCTMKIRHGPTIVEGILSLEGTDVGNVRLEKKDGGLAPGQFVVFYDGSECLGSAVISERHWLTFHSEHIFATE